MSALPAVVPTIAGSYVNLRAWEIADAALVAAASRDPQIAAHTTVPTTDSPAEIAAFIERQHTRLPDGLGYPFVIERAADAVPVGNIGLWTGEHLAHGRASIGYWIIAEFRQHGYLRAALDQLATWALRHDELERLQLFVEPWNEPSWRAAEACGFEREGLLRSFERVGGEMKDMYAYSRIST